MASGVASYEDAKFAHGYHSEEASVELFSTPFFNVDTNTDGVADNWTAFQANANSTFSIENHTGYGGKAQKAEITNVAYVASTLGVYQGGLNQANKTLTMRTTGVTNKALVQLLAYDVTNGANIRYTNFTVTPDVDFDEYITFAVPATCVNLRIYVTCQKGASWVVGDYIKVYAANLKEQAYPVSFHDGTKAADSHYYTLPAALPAEWFASGVWKPDQASTISRTAALLLAAFRYDTSNEYQLYYLPSSDKLYIQKFYGGTGVTLSSVALTFAAGNIIEWAAMQLIEAYGDLAAGMHLWYRINGGAVVHVSNTDTNLPTAPTKVYVGCLWAAGYEDNGVNDALHLVDVASEAAMGTTINNAWAEGFLTAATAPTADPATILLANMDDTTDAAATGGFVWLSAAKDVSGASDTDSGKVSYADTTPGSSTVAYSTRTSTDGTTWDAWTAVDGSGNIGSTHHDNIQLAVIGTVSGSDSPSLQSGTLSYDDEPAAVELATGFTAGGQFYFATLLSYLIITNMLDAPQKWDGTNAVAALGGSPPHGQYVATHKNYLFFAHTSANPSRLQFSDVLDLESYPALYFIDISPNDGDWITGLLSFDDFLVITKQRSIWLLVGDGPSSFEVRRLHSGVGCVAPRSLVRMGTMFTFVSTEGIYASDLSQPKLLTERLKTTWAGLNRRRLNQVCGEFFDHKLRVDVPNGSSTTNDLRIVYDSIRQCLMLEEFSVHASCYTRYTEAGQEILLYGHATEGQVSQADDGTTDAGAAIPMTWTTKHFNFGSSATLKKVRNLWLVVLPASSDVDLSVYLIVDGLEEATPLTETITGLANTKVMVYKLKPRNVNVRKIHTFGYRITQSTTNGGVRFEELVQEYLVKRVKES